MESGVGYAAINPCANVEYVGHSVRFELFFPVVGCGAFSHFVLGVVEVVSQAGVPGVWSADQSLAGYP